MAKDNSMQTPENALPDGVAKDDGGAKEASPNSIRRRANTGDIVEEAGDDSQKPLVRPLSFTRNDDYQGNEAKLPTDADFSRGSGWEGGKLWGEEALGISSGESTPPEEAAPKGFDLSEEQKRNRDAIARETMESHRADTTLSTEEKAKEGMVGDLRDQGRDLGRRQQATASQAFGRDIGSSALRGIEEGDEEEAILRRASQRHNSDWTAVLGKLGGASPGSEENLLLAEKFKTAKFPSTREEILEKLVSGAQFKVRAVSIGLRDAVSHSRTSVFRSMYDLIDCVKDEIRRVEKRQFHRA